MKPDQSPTTEAKQEGDKRSNPDLLDSVFDNVCPVPDLKCSDVQCGDTGKVEEKPREESKPISMFGRKSSTSAAEEADKKENDVGSCRFMGYGLGKHHTREKGEDRRGDAQAGFHIGIPLVMLWMLNSILVNRLVPWRAGPA